MPTHVNILPWIKNKTLFLSGSLVSKATKREFLEGHTNVMRVSVRGREREKEKGEEKKKNKGKKRGEINPVKQIQ